MYYSEYLDILVAYYFHYRGASNACLKTNSRIWRFSLQFFPALSYLDLYCWKCSDAGPGYDRLLGPELTPNLHPVRRTKVLTTQSAWQHKAQDGAR